jgi:hypothetical protein
MDDPEIVELCQRIYTNHPQALQLIYEHAGSPAAGLLGKIEALVAEHSGGWHIVNKTSTKVMFMPTRWFKLLTPNGPRPSFDPRCSIVFKFEIRRTKGFLGVSVCPTTKPEMR